MKEHHSIPHFITVCMPNSLLKNAWTNCTINRQYAMTFSNKYCSSQVQQEISGLHNWCVFAFWCTVIIRSAFPVWMSIRREFSCMSILDTYGYQITLTKHGGAQLSWEYNYHMHACRCTSTVSCLWIGPSSFSLLHCWLHPFVDNPLKRHSGFVCQRTVHIGFNLRGVKV